MLLPCRYRLSASPGYVTTRAGYLHSQRTRIISSTGQPSVVASKLLVFTRES
jgi:hypothetical protein